MAERTSYELPVHEQLAQGNDSQYWQKYMGTVRKLSSADFVVYIF